MSSRFIWCLANPPLVGEELDFFMCNEHEYTNFASMTIAGGPGDYVVRCPVHSNEQVEYNIVAIAVVGAAVGVIQTSGVDRLKTLDTTGNSTYNDNTFIRGRVFVCPGNNSIPMSEFWSIVANSQGDVFVRIDGATFATVTINMRVKILRKIPGPFTTVHPSQQQAYHDERARRIQQAVYGEEGELIEYGQRPGQPKTVRRLQAGEQPERERTGAEGRGGTRGS